MNVLTWLGRLSRNYHFAIGLLLTVLLGTIDYRTGYEFRMELFYLVPISYVTWFCGGRYGILFSILSVITIVYSDVMAGKKYTQFAVEFWNGATYLLFYLIVTVLLKLRKTVQQRESLLDDLDRALRQNEVLGGLLPVCAHCKKFRDDPEYRQQVTSYVSRHVNPELLRGVCRECASKK